MTEHDAINTLKYRMNTAIKIVGIGEDGKAFEDMEMAIKALEKQIPKKPIYQGESDRCPNCGVCYVFGNCCIECGQRIDWE